MSETEEYDEAERHLEALENAKWFEPKQSKYRIRISYNQESLWPRATLTALQAFDRSGNSIISKVGNAQETLQAKQRIQLADQGVHVVDSEGECSCGLVVEIERIDDNPVDDATVRRIVLSTPGHFDHPTRTTTDLFIAGELGPGKAQGYWLREPGPLVAATWHCVHCGQLGEAVPEKQDPTKFKAYKNPGAHERKWAALNVSDRRWESLKQIELKHWAETNTEGGNK